MNESKMNELTLSKYIEAKSKLFSYILYSRNFTKSFDSLLQPIEPKTASDFIKRFSSSSLVNVKGIGITLNSNKEILPVFFLTKFDLFEPRAFVNEIDFLSERDQIPIDDFAVLFTGPILARGRPVQPGDSIGTLGISPDETGTIGCIVKDNRGDSYILSCNHVLAALNRGTRHVTDIIQPGVADGGGSVDRIGVLYDYQYLHTDGVTPNEIDAALCKPDSASDVYPGTWITGMETNPKFNTKVKKTGWKTGSTNGIVKILHADIIMEKDTSDIVMLDQIGIYGDGSSPVFSEAGDSGSIVLDDKNEAIGMLIASATAHDLTFATPIEKVLTHFYITPA